MVFDKVAELIADVADIDVSEITMETKFADLGLDSLDIAELILNIENELNVKLEMDSSIVDVGSVVKKLEEMIG